MAYRTPLTLPGDQLTGVTITPQSVVGVSASEFTGAVQTHYWVGFWMASVSVANLSRVDASAWQAFLARLNGPEGTFLLGDPLAATPRGAGAGSSTPYLSGANVSGTSWPTAGWANNSAILKQGDYVQLGAGPDARLHMQLEDVSSDGSGNATLTVWPALREPRTTGSERTTNGTMDSLTGWTSTQTGGTVALDTGNKVQGTASFGLTRANTGALSVQQAYTAASSFLPRERYSLTFQARTTSGTGTVCAVRFRNTTKSLEVASDGVTWAASNLLVSSTLTGSWAVKRASIRIREDFATTDDYQLVFEHGNTSSNTLVNYDDCSLIGPSNNAVRIYTASPVGVFRLAGNVAGWTEAPPARYTSMKFDAVEAL